MIQRGTLFGLLIGLSLASACGPRAQAPASAVPAPAASASPSPAPTSQSMGFLAGRASIGPLQPVERIGVPSPTPPPAACTNRGLVMYSTATGSQVNHISFAADCTYRVALPAGSYRVELAGTGVDRSPDLPKTVTIIAGQTTQLDVSIDTGIR